MASLVLGVVGSQFGGAFGYAIGAAIGGMIDNSMVADTQIQGPKLGDLKVQTSSYGKSIPVARGKIRLAGNMFWSTDVIETNHTSSQSQGGKGGGPSTVTTTYTYSQSFAIAICEGEIDGIGRIWANGALIYNVSSSADAATAAASLKVASAIRIYTGSETQTADSLIQAYVGAANTPAYRGVAYVVFENFQLADYGNRTPNIEFEVIETDTVATAIGALIATELTSASALMIKYHANTASVIIIKANSIVKISALTGAVTTLPLSIAGAGTANYELSGDALYGYSTAYQVSKIDIFTGNVTYTANAYWYLSDPVADSRGDVWGNGVIGGYSGKLVRVTTTPFAVVGAWQTVHTINNTGYDPITDSLWVSWGNSVSYGVDKYTILNGIPSYIATYQTGPQPTKMCYDSATQSIWILSATGYGVSCIACATGVSTFYSVGVSPVDVCFVEWSSTVWVSRYLYSQYATKIIDVVSGSMQDSGYTGTIHFQVYDQNGGVWGQNIANEVIKLAGNSYGLSSSPPTLGSVVSGICARAGVTPAQIDVTQLTDSVDGYTTQRSTARAQIEQLMQAFYFDAVESDGKIKFVKRGGSAALTIIEDDLAAHLYGGEPPDNLVIDRKQELELPVEVNVQYLDEASAYQVNSQRSQRLTTSSVDKVTMNFAISMTASKAKQISDVLMFDAWTARTSFAMSNSWKYSYLEPTDIIGVTKGSTTYNVRIVDEDASGGVYSRNMVLDDASVYTQTANAAAPIAPTTTVSSAPIINLVLMDIPILRDQDDAVGFYAAACKYTGTWAGEQTYRSNDGGGSWASFGRTILNEADIGSATTLLGDFFGGNIFDELHSVTVSMINGALASDTELNVLNGANVMLLGNEILQFKNATLVSAGVYSLTGLLRGRRGTEWAMSTHAIGDRAVVLASTATYLLDNSSAEYNLSRQYRGVSIGGFLADAYSQSFTNTAVAQECYAPVKLGGGRNSANDVVLNWIRRTRIGGAWNDYADVPLGESSEVYAVEIYSSATYVTLLRTISGLTAATTTYTAAQQTTDGLTPGNPVYFIVYQVSALVGSGYGARGVV